MTYSVSGKIQASDINGFLNDNTPNLNKIWSTGSGDYGYGQTAVAGVAVKDKVRTQTWTELLSAITKIANHQGTTIGAMTNTGGLNPGTTSPTIPGGQAPTTGIPISYLNNLNLPALTNNLALITNNRMNTVRQGNDSSTTVTTTTTWSNVCTATFTISFASHAAARYFFNAGGQIATQASHPNTTNINRLISEICSDMGTLWMSSPSSGTVSLAGTNFSGVQKAGGATGNGSTINTNYGFYAWTSTSTQVQRQLGSFSYTGHFNGTQYNTSTFGQVNVAYNGSGVVTVTVVLDEVPNGAVVSAGTSVTLKIRPPSTTYFSEGAWGKTIVSGTGQTAGQIAVSGTITPSN
jgi:hypothetical protein